MPLLVHNPRCRLQRQFPSTCCSSSGSSSSVTDAQELETGATRLRVDGCAAGLFHNPLPGRVAFPSLACLVVVMEPGEREPYEKRSRSGQSFIRNSQSDETFQYLTQTYHN